MNKLLSYGAIILLALSTKVTQAQVTGGQHAFEFLRLSNSPYVSALGGIAPASPDLNVSLTLQNPALLRPEFDKQLSLNYNVFYAGIGIVNLQYAFHHKKINTDFGVGIQYLNYGKILHTDVNGNELGNASANDYSINLSASRQYLEKWRYGATLKWAQSQLAGVSGAALVADLGITYMDTVSKLTIGAVAKNIGVVVQKFNPNNPAEPLPFDLQIGLTKQLKNVPLRLFIVAHHLYRWDVKYDNPADIVKNVFDNDEVKPKGNGFGDKLFRHLNFGVELIIAKRFTATVGYSHIRRKENGLEDKMGMAGFSFGFSLDLNKMQVRYGQTYYGTAGAYNEFGLNFDLDKFIKTKKKTPKITS